ncbi:MAG TPA: PASTA domain-containing protein, partial [Sedimentisphaerales bacterium]|nr:PASTA domain-containing protein [Sedimentisphaerales bacterium]
SYSDTVPADLVIASNPSAGASVAYGSSVDLVISLGHAPVTVPNVLNMTEAQAEAALNAVGLNKGSVTTSYSNTVPVDLVISSNPSAGTSVAYGSSVDLVISLGRAPVSVPDVRNMTEPQAETALNAAGLNKGGVSTSYSDTVPADLVIASNPSAGASVAYGSSVDLVISLGHAPVTVPSVPNMTESQAQAALNAVGLNKGSVTTSYSDTVPADLVISSNPSAGTSVAYGSSVDLVISLGHAPVTVPDVLNMTESQAEAALNAVGLNKGAVTTSYSDTVPADLVISSNPSAGASVAYGSSVDLVISLGQEAGPQTYVWTNAYPWSMLWLSRRNWDPVAPFGGPGDDDSAIVRGEPYQGPVVDWNVNVGSISGPQAYEGQEQIMLVLEGANMQVNDSWNAQDERGTGILEIYDGSINIDGGMRVADNGAWILRLFDGVLSVGSELRAGDSEGATMELNVSGGELNAGALGIGDDGTGTINITGGIVNVEEDIWLNLRKGGFITVNIGGGVVNAGPLLMSTLGGETTLNMNGGEVNVDALIIADESDNGVGIINMDAGALTIQGDLRAPARGSATISLDGGVVDAGAFIHDNDDWYMNITHGQMWLNGDVSAGIQADVDAGRITAFGAPSRGEVMIEVVGGRTHVWAEPHFDRAYGPYPAHKATGVQARDLVLSWSPGDGAVKHHVFFSDNQAAVAGNQLSAYKGSQTAAAYALPPLQLGKTYYWMIVEEQTGGILVDGWLWYFTVEEARVIDDMESYTQNPNYIFETWKDGCGDAQGMNGNGTGSCIELSLTRTHSGSQAMWYSYETYRDTGWERDANYAEATRTFGTPQDWLASGEAALVLWFYGVKTNDSAPMWVAVNDGADETMHTYGAYGDDVEDIKKQEWIDWNIALADLVLEVDLTNVVSLSIGFGDRTTQAEGGKGVVFFDDIALWPVRCVPKYVTEVVDLNDDCVTDWGDILVLGRWWLEDRR